MAALKKGGKSRRKRTRIKYHFEKHGTWSKFKGITRANPLHSFRSFPPGPEWQRYKGYVSKAQAYNIAKNLQAEAPHLEIGVSRERIYPGNKFEWTIFTRSKNPRRRRRNPISVSVLRRTGFGGVMKGRKRLTVVAAHGDSRALAKAHKRDLLGGLSTRGRQKILYSGTQGDYFVGGTWGKGKRRNPLTRKEAASLAKTGKIVLRAANQFEKPYNRGFYRGQAAGMGEALRRSGYHVGGRLVRKALSYKNPAREVTIYANVRPFTIYAVKGKNSNYPGQLFRHRFRGGGRATGLADGSIRLYPAPGKRLWSMIRQRGR